MKRLLFVLMPFLLAAAVSVSFISCGDDDDDEYVDDSTDETLDPEKALIGTWKFSNSTKEETFTFKANYTGTTYMYYKSTKMTNNATITWKLSGYPYVVSWEGLNKWSGSGESGEDWIGGKLKFDGKNLYDGSTQYTKQ